MPATLLALEAEVRSLTMSPIAAPIRSATGTGSGTVTGAASAATTAIDAIATATTEGLLLSRGRVAAEDDEPSN